MEQYKADVVIVGGGLAALRAALEAKKASPRVLMVSKGRIGKSGCSLISEGILNAPISESDSPELFSEDLIKASAGVADVSLAKTFSANAKDEVLGLQSYGISFCRDDQELTLSHSGGHSMARTVRIDPPGPACGKMIPTTLIKHVHDEDIELLEGYQIVKIFTHGDRAAGALALGKEGFVSISFKSIVLATGGGGKLYPNSTNPAGIVGDGYYLAHDAGASLVDMEYVQFFPTVAFENYLVLPFVFSDGATLKNKLGERFIEKYDPELKEMTTRDKMSQAIFDEVLEGRGENGCVFIHFSDIPEEVLEKKYGKEIEFFKKKGIDVTKQPLPVKPSCHFFMGGIKIDSSCQTAIGGLYACGECAGGVHGANRLAGNALAEALVFGAIAGRSAAKYAEDEQYGSFDPEPYISSLPEDGTGKRGQELLDQLRSIMWEHLGIIRNEDGILTAMKKISSIRKEFESDGATYELKQYFELRNALHIAYCIAMSALVRNETRGAHYRSDFPESSQEWAKKIEIRKDFVLSTCK